MNRKRYMQNTNMKKQFPLIIIGLLFACSTIPEIHLKSDGLIYTNGKPIAEKDLKTNLQYSEVILTVDHDVPYEKVVELMVILKKSGVKKVGLKSNIHKQE